MMEVELDGVPLDERKLVKGVDDAIIAIEFEMERKMEAIKRTEQKLQLSENEKIRIGAEYALQRNIKRLIKYFKKTINAHLGKMPPQAIDLEESILGAIMLEQLAFPAVKKFLKPEHFYVEAHQLIFQAITDLSLIQDAKIDMRTVVDRLRKNGHIELIGGAHYIAELTAKVSSAANIEYHSRVIIEYAMKRELLMMASDIMLKAYDDQVDTIEMFEDCKGKIIDLNQWLKK